MRQPVYKKKLTHLPAQELQLKSSETRLILRTQQKKEYGCTIGIKINKYTTSILTSK